MIEFARFISPEVFESGLERRLLVGEVVVGQICKIRVENFGIDTPVQYVEATISVLGKYPTEAGQTIRYLYEATRDSGNPLEDTETFNDDSISIFPVGHFRTYLSDDLDPRWDASLKELIDLESGIDITN